MCSIDGACDAPMPPTTLAIRSSALAHLLADLGERGAGDAEQLHHHVDRHPVPPEADPVALDEQLLLLGGEAELIEPAFLVGCEERALLLVLQRVRGLVESHAPPRRLLVEEIERRRQ